MRILKTALRSSLGQDRFNSLAVIKMNWDIEVDIQNVINVNNSLQIKIENLRCYLIKKIYFMFL